MKKYLDMIIVALLVVILLQMCKKPLDTTTTIVYSDTIWVKKDSTIYSNPKLIIREGSVDSVILKEYLPDTNYNKLLAQYNSLVTNYLTKNVYEDSLKIDSVGYVYVKDEVMSNALTGRTYNYNLTYPIIHDSVVKYAAPQREFYFGGGIQGFQGGVIRTFNTGLLYKDKKQRIYILSGTVDNENKLGAQLQTYWKLK